MSLGTRNQTQSIPPPENVIGNMPGKNPLDEDEFERISTGTRHPVFKAVDPDVPELAFKGTYSLFGKYSLDNDYQVHEKMKDALHFAKTHDIDIDVHVPRPVGYERAWPTSDRRSAHVSCVERIFPVPKMLRTTVLERTRMQEELRLVLRGTSEWNHCLLKPYLGADERSWNFRGPGSMQDYPLPTDTFIKVFGERTYRYTCAQMGRALALLHWYAEVDGKGVKFVLGAVRELDKKIGGPSAAIWMVNFDECKRLQIDEQGMRNVAVSYFECAPHLPRPDQQGWAIFSHEYIRAASKINYERGLIDDIQRGALAYEFISAIKRQHRALQANPVEWRRLKSRHEGRDHRSPEVSEFWKQQYDEMMLATYPELDPLAPHDVVVYNRHIHGELPPGISPEHTSRFGNLPLSAQLPPPEMLGGRFQCGSVPASAQLSDLGMLERRFQFGNAPGSAPLPASGTLEIRFQFGGLAASAQLPRSGMLERRFQLGLSPEVAQSTVRANCEGPYALNGGAQEFRPVVSMPLTPDSCNEHGSEKGAN